MGFYGNPMECYGILIRTVSQLLITVWANDVNSRHDSQTESVTHPVMPGSWSSGILESVALACTNSERGSTGRDRRYLITIVTYTGPAAAAGCQHERLAAGYSVWNSRHAVCAASLLQLVIVLYSVCSAYS